MQFYFTHESRLLYKCAVINLMNRYLCLQKGCALACAPTTRHGNRSWSTARGPSTGTHNPFWILSHKCHIDRT